MDKKERFIQAIQENEGLIYKIAAAYSNTADDRNDLAQEIIYQLWKSFDSFREASSLSTWMYRVAMNVAIYQLRIAKRKPATVPMEEAFINIRDNDNTIAEEKWKLFRERVDKLNLLDKGIIILYLENRTYEEIAGIIGISVSNVGTRLSRIKEKLKQEIAKQN